MAINKSRCTISFFSGAPCRDPAQSWFFDLLRRSSPTAGERTAPTLHTLKNTNAMDPKDGRWHAAGIYQHLGWDSWQIKQVMSHQNLSTIISRWWWIVLVFIDWSKFNFLSAIQINSFGLHHSLIFLGWSISFEDHWLDPSGANHLSSSIVLDSEFVCDFWAIIWK